MGDGGLFRTWTVVGVRAETANSSPALPSIGNIAWIAAIIAIVALQCVLTLTHRPWLDEWQALQIALFSPSQKALFENLRYEGHPPLWYWWLQAWSALAPPLKVSAMAALPLAIVTQLTLLTRLPFLRWQRAAVALSTFVMFDYFTISRSLSLGAALLVAAMLWRDRRWCWIAIALLPLADFLFGVLSIVMILIQWKDRRIERWGIALWLVCALLAAWSVRPADDMIPALWLNGLSADLTVTIARFSTLLLPTAFTSGSIAWNQTLPLAAALPLGCAFVIILFHWNRGLRINTLILAAMLALMVSFSCFVYPLAIRHLSLLALLAILLMARSVDQGFQLPPTFSVWLGAIALCGITTSAAALNRPFDTAPETARSIERMRLSEKHWLSFPDSRAQGVSALTGIAFERLERNCTQSFVRWNYRSSIKQPEDLQRELDRIASQRGRVYLLSEYDLGVIRHLKPIHFEPAGIDGQAFYLYIVHPELPERPVALPSCVGDAARQRPLRS